MLQPDKQLTEKIFYYGKKVYETDCGSIISLLSSLLINKNFSTEIIATITLGILPNNIEEITTLFNKLRPIISPGYTTGTPNNSNKLNKLSAVLKLLQLSIEAPLETTSSSANTTVPKFCSK